MSEGKDVFVLEMGEQVRIVDLARRMIRLAGRRVGDDIEIRVTGTRPGEKLVEELHAPEENLEPTSHVSIKRLRPATMSPVDIETALHPLERAAAAHDDDHARAELFRLTEQVDRTGDLVAESPG